MDSGVASTDMRPLILIYPLMRYVIDTVNGSSFNDVHVDTFEGGNVSYWASSAQFQMDVNSASYYYMAIG